MEIFLGMHTGRFYASFSFNDKNLLINGMEYPVIHVVFSYTGIRQIKSMHKA